MVLVQLSDNETMTVSEARREFSDLLNRVHRDETLVVVEKNGIPMAGIVPMPVVRAAQERESQRKELLAFLNRTQLAFSDVPEEEIEREVEKAVAEVKQQRKFARRIVAAIIEAMPEGFDLSDAGLEAIVVDVLRNEERSKNAEQRNRSADAS